MLAKIIIILGLMAVMSALGTSLYFMVKDGDKSLRTTKALTWRIFFTIILLIFIIFAYHQGWIHPNQLIQF
jgi:hypothetical protein